jgi:hypothetical protein
VTVIPCIVAAFLFTLASHFVGRGRSKNAVAPVVAAPQSGTPFAGREALPTFSAAAQASSTPSPASAPLMAKAEPSAEKPAASPQTAVSASPPALSSAEQNGPPKPGKTVERKAVERERRQAERKRSRLEALYQKHRISEEAYKDGQNAYRIEMARYRSALDSLAPKNE